MCGHSESEHYPLHLWMNGCRKDWCECTEWIENEKHVLNL